MPDLKAPEKHMKFVAIPADVMLRQDPKEMRKYGMQPMTPDEVKQKKKDEAEYNAQVAEREAAEKANKYKRDRADAFGEKWPDEFALIDDILNRGTEAVREERAAIRAKFPKPKGKAE